MASVMVSDKRPFLGDRCVSVEPEGALSPIPVAWKVVPPAELGRWLLSLRGNGPREVTIPNSNLGENSGGEPGRVLPWGHSLLGQTQAFRMSSLFLFRGLSGGEGVVLCPNS